MHSTKLNHVPVLQAEVLNHLNLQKDGIYVDCTFGLGGHSKSILSSSKFIGTVYAFDVDKNAIEDSTNWAKSFPNLKIFHDNYVNFDKHLSSKVLYNIDGFLLDLGISSYQLDNPSRGFSFANNGPLDMRMDQTKTLTAKEIVNTYSEKKLQTIFHEYSDLKDARAISKFIVKSREENGMFSTTTSLNDALKTNFIHYPHHLFLKKLRRIYQALRIEVNCELMNFHLFLKKVTAIMKKMSRLLVITYHSQEAKLLRYFFKLKAQSLASELPKLPIFNQAKSEFKFLKGKPIVPTMAEIMKNSRSKSAQLWIIIKGA